MKPDRVPVAPGRAVLRRGAIAAAAFLLSACASGGERAPTQPGNTAPPGGGTTQPGSGLSATVSAYFGQLVGIMATNSIKRFTIDWPSFQAQISSVTPNAQTVLEAYPAIREALRILGDGHSSYTGSNGTFLYVPNRTCTASGAPTPPLPANIGYVRVGAFSGTTAQATAFANSIQAIIRTNDRADLIGWVVDLRGNGGGNMWPMIAGLGPILGDGRLGYFIDPVGVRLDWEYRDGASWNQGFAVQRVDQPYTLFRPLPKVAVLVDNGVASSGEATYIAFRGRENTRSFGTATCGLSTANRGFPLNDGAVLNLTVSTMADRTGRAYGDQVVPDEVIPDQAQAAARAVAWLQGPAR